MILNLIVGLLLAGNAGLFWLFMYFAGATVVSIGAVAMMFFLKGWWYNYDPQGYMRCNQEWDFFGVDDFYNPYEFEPEDTEEEEVEVPEEINVIEEN